MMDELEERTRKVLRAWQLGIVASDEVSAWTDARMLESTSPRALPSWFLTLAARGPEACLRLPFDDFPFRWAQWSIREEFLSCLHQLDPRATDGLSHLVAWLSHEVIGGDLQDPIVKLGYRLEHHAYSLGSMEQAIEALRESIPSFMDDLKAFVADERAEVESK
jgi:hypothetical protein